MRILLVTSELAPYTGLTPAGEACAALPKALQARGHSLMILCPLYGYVDPTRSNLARRLRTIALPPPGPDKPFTVYDARTPAGVELMFLGHETLLAPVTELPTGESSENVERFGAFCRAALEVIRQDDAGFSAVHCHGWPTALLPALAKSAGLELGTVLTLDGEPARGAFDASRYGVESAASFLESGVASASALTTVSAGVVSQLRDEASSLGEALRARNASVQSVPSGLDTAVFNPATDAHLPTRYDPMDLRGKGQCKARFQEALELPIRADVPLVVAVGAFDDESGLSAIARLASKVLRNDVQLAVVAQSHDENAWAVLEEHRVRWPDRLALLASAETGDLHRGLAAADLLLLPPRLAPGSSLHLAAFRYGALPIAARHGSMGDVVVDCDPALESGNGFLFDDGSDDAVLATVQRAVAAFALGRPFARRQSAVMRTDVGWERGAYLYEQIYESVGKTASL